LTAHWAKRGADKPVALLDPEALGLGMTVFVQVNAARQDPAWLIKFAKDGAEIAQIVEFYLMSGEYDDMQAFDVFYKSLVEGIDLSEVTSSFAMEKIKYTSALPV
jgi:Lrp/AsnC family transcriptional regulator